MSAILILQAFSLVISDPAGYSLDHTVNSVEKQISERVWRYENSSNGGLYFPTIYLDYTLENYLSIDIGLGPYPTQQLTWQPEFQGSEHNSPIVYYGQAGIGHSGTNWTSPYLDAGTGWRLDLEYKKHFSDDTSDPPSSYAPFGVAHEAYRWISNTSGGLSGSEMPIESRSVSDPHDIQFREYRYTLGSEPAPVGVSATVWPTSGGGNIGHQ